MPNIRKKKDLLGSSVTGEDLQPLTREVQHFGRDIPEFIPLDYKLVNEN